MPTFLKILELISDPSLPGTAQQNAKISRFSVDLTQCSCYIAISSNVDTLTKVSFVHALFCCAVLV